MRGLLNISSRLDGFVDGLLERRPWLESGLAKYGFLALVVTAAVAAISGAAVPEGRGQEVVYATDDGGIVSLSLDSGEKTTVFDPADDGFAVAPSFGGGSRSLSFTVLRGGNDFRGDLYGADLVRGTRALLQGAERGEVFLNGGYSSDREWLTAERYSADEPPNVAVLAASGAETLYVEPLLRATSAILGPAWTARNSIYGWREGNGDQLSLTAYNYFERRQAVVYETEKKVGRPFYNFDSNTIVFDERPADGGLEGSSLEVIVGTAEYPVKRGEGLGVYDPSPPVPELDYRMAVIWTDGKRSGVGLFDPGSRVFERTAVEVEKGSRQPQVSHDGTYVATTDAAGETLTIRTMDDGEVVRTIDGVQPPEEAFDRMEPAGLDVPPEARWFAPSAYVWRSVADS